jgi:LL-diaminopimelate aminotransferase
MAFLNHHYLKLKAGYLFPEIARRVRTFTEQQPQAALRLLRCGIGDVTEPLPPAVIAALHQAVEEMGRRESFRGYGPEQGYEFLRHVIAQRDYRDRGMEIENDEIFISDGSKCDSANLLDIFGHQNRIAVMDPVYPVYVDTNVMAGHTGPADPNGVYPGLIYLPCTPANGFVPEVPNQPVDLIYLCYPNNPTGAVATRPQLEAWVNYARAHDAILLYDAAYEAYIADPAIPRSIFEIPGARDCAIEFRSFSKQGGFTGTRCAFTVLPKSLQASVPEGGMAPLHPLWLRRMTTKFNGVSYPVQRAAQALYSEDGQAQVRQLIDLYMGNARILREAVLQASLTPFGGVNAPYLWVQAPPGISSWQAFDHLLHQANVVVTPGSGFGLGGEGFFRISAFNSRANATEVAQRLTQLKW